MAEQLKTMDCENHELQLGNMILRKASGVLLSAEGGLGFVFAEMSRKGDDSPFAAGGS
jgi:hypothetical protein